ncbi:N-(5'-phosphoribosyl)anthranilate isomerase [Halomonadaceae bacterium LMG 33818]|uniref:phosphoribosylanthranilate isomerase n=1 Tax=Cernens ardua TaxID=3402176 RepID=UPI003EDBB59E
MKSPFLNRVSEPDANVHARTHIKFCGMSREQDIEAAVNAGADALGFVLWSNSKRAITLAQLSALSKRVPETVSRVGLFVNPTAREVADAAPYLDLVQFHGDESPEFCNTCPIPWIKALRMHPDLVVEKEVARYTQASGILLDAYHPEMPGGTGQRFDWARVPQQLALPIILAGGLSADNVAKAITLTAPYAVDVSGGVESEPGKKSSAKMNEFALAVKEADAKRGMETKKATT